MSEDMKESAQETTPIRIVELDPKWWLHGEGGENSCLLRDSDTQAQTRVALLNEVLENSTLTFRFKLKDFSPSEKHGD